MTRDPRALGPRDRAMMTRMGDTATIIGALPPRRTPALEARELTVVADGYELLSSVSLSVDAGELVALIGPSGAGKTTLLRALSGTRALHTGSVLLGSEPIRPRNFGVGYVPSEDLLHDPLTVSEELLFAAALRAPATAEVVDLGETVAAVLADLTLTELAEMRVANLSRGERRRVSCAVELVGQPEVLLLDEPAGGLDAGLERRVMKMLRRLADQGRAVLAATHATASLRLCDRVAVMGSGGVLHCVGSVDDVLASFQVDNVEAVYERLELAAERRPGSEPAPLSLPIHRAERPAPSPSGSPSLAPAPARPALGLARQLEIAAPRRRCAACAISDRWRSCSGRLR
jgi:ABC-type multidrug transport system ATPase subunit